MVLEPELWVVGLRVTVCFLVEVLPVPGEIVFVLETEDFELWLPDAGLAVGRTYSLLERGCCDGRLRYAFGLLYLVDGLLYLFADVLDAGFE